MRNTAERCRECAGEEPVVAAVALYPGRAELQREYPELEDEDIRQAPEYPTE